MAEEVSGRVAWWGRAGREGPQLDLGLASSLRAVAGVGKENPEGKGPTVLPK